MKSPGLLVTLALSFALAASALAAADNPQMGTWKLNEAKSKLAPGTGKNNTVVYSESGGKIQVTVDGVDKDGKPTHSVWKGMMDGKPYPVTGNPMYDMWSYRTVNDHTNELTATKGGKVVMTVKVEVAKDGKSRTVTSTGTDASGKKFTSKAVYDKA